MSIGLVDVAVRLALAAGTAVLFTVVFLAYLRVRSRKLLFISTGFGIFFAQAVFGIPELFLGLQVDENIHLFLHFVVLLFVLVGTLKD